LLSPEHAHVFAFPQFNNYFYFYRFDFLMMMKVSIDPESGFCFGVVNAIQVAERELSELKQLYCLGDIVHNNMEVNRLHKKGLRIIDHEQFSKLHDCKVLIRAHGEPPETYRIALRNNIELIDASCPVVLKLQNRIKEGYDLMKAINGQIVIYGKDGHAEVNGLVGQTKDTAIIVESESDLDKIDFTRPIRFYSQTTKSTDGFQKLKQSIEQRVKEINPEAPDFIAYDTICRQVANRAPQLKNFARMHDVVIFVSGKKSSNGLFLYDICRSANLKTYLVSGKDEINKDWFADATHVGVCGATSTPKWAMEKIAAYILTLNN